MTTGDENTDSKHLLLTKLEWDALCHGPCLLCTDLDCLLNGCRRKRRQETEAEDG
jgi:hypothetical protein